MKKSDLKDLMVVEFNDQKRYVFVGDALFNLDGYIEIIEYEEDLTYSYKDRKHSINKIYKVKSMPCGYRYANTLLEEVLKDENLVLFWERPESIKLTDSEKIILKSINKVFNYIARDRSGRLYVYEYKPRINSSGQYYAEYGGETGNFTVFDNIFQGIQSEYGPQLIESLIK